jgi:hypothetical protein
MKDAPAAVGNILEALEAALGPEEVWETVGWDPTVFHHACFLGTHQCPDCQILGIGVSKDSGKGFRAWIPRA